MEKLDLHIFRARPKKNGPAFPSAYCTDYMASEISVKEYGDRFTAMVLCYTKDDVIATVNSKADFERVGNLLIDKFFSRDSYLDDLITWSSVNKNILRDYITVNLGENIIQGLSNAEIGERYCKYADLYRYFHLKNTPAWWVGADALLKRVSDFLKSTGVESVDGMVAKLTDASEYKTENFEEELSLLKIAEELQSLSITKIDDSVLVDNLSIKNKLEKHTEEFTSIPFGYNTGVLWKQDHFIAKLNEILSKGSARNLIQLKLAEVENKKKAQAEVQDSLKLPEEINKYLKYLRQLAYLQELKKTTQARSHLVLQLVVKKEIAKRLNISVEHLDYMSETEARDSLILGKMPEELLRQVDERLIHCVLIMRESKYEWLIGDEAAEFFKLHGLSEEVDANIKEIKGTPACKGKARGTVRVCKISTEIGKIEEGDILVTAMTTPDFVPAMRKAAAIITDEGGITCHAAIVSRELSKPCIIGTKIATKVLKDGDMVEVDADKGVVKIIK